MRSCFRIPKKRTAGSDPAPEIQRMFRKLTVFLFVFLLILTEASCAGANVPGRTEDVEERSFEEVSKEKGTAVRPSTDEPTDPGPTAPTDPPTESTDAPTEPTEPAKNINEGPFEIGDTGLYFSHRSGFYDSEFVLTIDAPEGAKVYYTLDSTDPNPGSTPYTDGIHIYDASLNPNKYSMRTDTSGWFYQDLVLQYSWTDEYFAPPSALIDKCTVVRAIAVLPDGSVTKAATETYFVGYNEKEGYEDVGVITVTTDPSNLFDYNKGIYVTGVHWDMYRSVLGTPEQLPDWWMWSANYTQHGIEWERPAYIEFFGSDRSLQLAQDAGIRIKGGGSRGFVDKSLNFYAREEYGDKKFRYDFFENGYISNRLTLFSGGDDNYNHIKDQFVASFLRDGNVNVTTMHFVPYVLFLDGEYWGYYQLTEKFTDNFFEYYYGVDKDEVVFIKEGEVEEGNPEDIQLFRDMKNTIYNMDMSSDSAYARLESFIDMSSCIDYYATGIYIGRENDWPKNNYGLWRTRSAGEGYGDGRWRWVVFDVNSTSMKSEDLELDSFAHIMANDYVFACLMNNRTFRERLFARLYDMETIFSSEKATAAVDAFFEKIQLQYLKEGERFHDEKVLRPKQIRTCNRMRTWFRERPAIIHRLIANYSW